MKKHYIVIDICHGGSFSYSFTCNELRKLKNLIVKKGTQNIGEKTFTATEGFLTVHKMKNGNISGGYDMDKKTALLMVNALINSECQ